MKRVIAVSDSHGAWQDLQAAFLQARISGRIDVAVFLGDGSSDFARVRPQLEAEGTVCYAVCGNNDWSSPDPRETAFMVGKVKFYVCHGHARSVKYGLDRLWYAAQENEAQVALYGHTHVANSEVVRGIHFINPGAVCDRSSRSIAYADIRLEDNGAVLPRLIRWA